jgi:hypothetical protein
VQPVCQFLGQFSAPVHMRQQLGGRLLAPSVSA